MKITVKSTPENWEKELDPNKKPNTVRFLDGNDIIQINRTTDGKPLYGDVTDITTGQKEAIIISFKNPRLEEPKKPMNIIDAAIAEAEDHILLFPKKKPSKIINPRNGGNLKPIQKFRFCYFCGKKIPLKRKDHTRTCSEKCNKKNKVEKNIFNGRIRRNGAKK